MPITINKQSPTLCVGLFVQRLSGDTEGCLCVYHLRLAGLWSSSSLSEQRANHSPGSLDSVVRVIGSCFTSAPGLRHFSFTLMVWPWEPITDLKVEEEVQRRSSFSHCTEKIDASLPNEACLCRRLCCFNWFVFCLTDFTYWVFRSNSRDYRLGIQVIIDDLKCNRPTVGR